MTARRRRGPSRGSRPWAVIAGGGTAGHVLPGIAVAHELVGRGHTADSIQFVGAARGPEADLVPAAGFDVTLLPGRGLERRLSLRNVAATWGLLRAVAKSMWLIGTRRPAVVLSLGGFASAACAVSAVLWRVPLVIAEQNARAGASNRLVARFASACAVPFPDTDLPNTVVTGNPVRQEILDAAEARGRDDAARRLGIPAERIIVVCFAGSLGARRINESVWDAVNQWADRSDVAVHHVVGARDWEDRRELPSSQLHYRPVRYEQHMELALAAADVAVCRSGGTTVAELAVMGVPSLLVPLPIATRDHQRANAAPLVEAGAAVLVPDDELDGDRLVEELTPLLGRDEQGRERRDSMAAAARSLATPDAASRVADLVEAAAKTCHMAAP